MNTAKPAEQKTVAAENRLHILIVEDDLVDRTQIERLLHRSAINYRTIATEYLDRAIELLQNNKFDVVLLDLNLPDSQGLETLSKIISHKFSAAVVVTTGVGADEMGLKAVSMGAHDYLIKGEFDTSSLTKAIFYSIERKKAEQEREKAHHIRQGINLLQQSLLGALPLEEKVKRVTDDVVKLFDADFCRIWIIGKGDLCEKGCVHAEVTEGPHACRFRQRCLHLVASSGRYTHIDGKVHRRVPFDCYAIGLVASNQEHKFLTNDVQNNPRIHDHNWAKELGLVSFASYQLYIEGGKPLGVMALFAKHLIEPADDVMLEGICSATALAIQQDLTSKKLQESEARYRSFIEVTDQIAWVANPRGEVEEDLPAWRKFTGQTYEQIKGSGWAKALHPDDIEQTLRIWTEAVSSRKQYETEYRLRRYDGVYKHLLARGFPVIDQDGNVKEWVGTCIDITERKQAEEEAIRNQNRQKALLELSQKSDLSIDEICNYSLNEAVKLTGSEIGYIGFLNDRESELSIKYWSESAKERCSLGDKSFVFGIKDLGLLGEAIRCRKAIVINDYEASHPAKKGIPQGHARIARFMNVPIFDANRIVAVAAVGNKKTDYTQADVTQLTLMMEGMWRIIHRKRSEEAVQIERNKAQKYLDIAGVMILVLDNGKTIHRINNKGCDILGYSEEELVGKNWCENFVPPEYRKDVEEVLQGLMSGQTEKYEYHENPVLTKSGQQRLIAWHNVVLWDESKRINAVLSSGEDITERRAAEIELIDAYKKLEKAHSDMKNMQSQIVQNEKLASIGQLAAGVAHEMNTPVGFVASNFETLEKYFNKFKTLLDMYSKLGNAITNAEKAELAARYELIRKTAKELKIDFILEDIGSLFKESKDGLARVTTIIQSLRDFSRIDQAEAFAEYDINRGIEATLAVARNAIKYHSKVTADFGDIPHVPCNASQINQVFLNIIVNAAQAIESQHRQELGNIKIKTYATDKHVICQIEDDGPGIPPEYINKVFDPFFTTKPAGKGTGLGLAISRDIIVNKHKGELLVESEVGKGAKFTIKLPLKVAMPVQSDNQQLPAETAALVI